jgi:hypothetical protein
VFWIAEVWLTLPKLILMLLIAIAIKDLSLLLMLKLCQENATEIVHYMPIQTE